MSVCVYAGVSESVCVCWERIGVVMLVKYSTILLQEKCISFLLLLQQMYHKLSSLKQRKCIIFSSMGQKFDASFTELKSRCW